jgi:hypothetical protein
MIQDIFGIPLWPFAIDADNPSWHTHHSGLRRHRLDDN